MRLLISTLLAGSIARAAGTVSVVDNYRDPVVEGEEAAGVGGGSGKEPFDVSGAGRVAQAGEAPGFFGPTAFFDEGVVQWGGIMGFPGAMGKDMNPVKYLFKGGTEAIYAFVGFIWSGKVSGGGPDFYPYDKGFGNHEVQHPMIDINVGVPAPQAPDNRFDFSSRGGSRLKEAGIDDTAGSFATLDNEGGAVVDEATDFGSACVGSPGWRSGVARFLKSAAESWELVDPSENDLTGGAFVANMFGWSTLLALAVAFAHSNPNKAKGKGRRLAQSTTKRHSRASLLFAMTFLLKCALGENLGNLQGSSLHLPEEPTEENHLRGSEELEDNHRKLESSVLFDPEPAMARTKQTARKKAGSTKAAKTKASKTKAAKTKAAKSTPDKNESSEKSGGSSSDNECDMSQFVGSWLYVSSKCPGDVFVEISCDDMKRGPCYYHEVHTKMCAFGTSAMQAFDPRHYLDLDECTIGLDRQVHLTQFSEGREKCDSENPKDLSVKIRRDFLNDQILIDFAENGSNTYYTEGEPRVAMRLRNSRHLMSTEDHCALEDQIAGVFGRRLQCTACSGLWKDHLPWNNLKDSSNNELVVDRDINRGKWRDDCLPEFNRRLPQLGSNLPAAFQLVLPPGTEQVPFGDRSCWGLTDQKSGLCTCEMFNAFESSDPKPKSAIFDSLGDRIVDMAGTGAPFYPTYKHLVSSTFIDERGVTTPSGFNPYSEYKSWIEDDGHSNMELPGAVLFPSAPYDVYAAVHFARAHGLKISVKTSGHSYSGSGTRRNTLHLNMRKYRKYTNVVPCNDTIPDSPGSDLNDLPCYLAHKRKDSRCRELPQDCGEQEWKPGYLVIGGGQNWAEAYGAVHEYNEGKPEHEKYHAVGGNTATVSPNGWGLQGGLSGTSLGRRFGYGVDQPLMYELMLATGELVRFGPTDTEHVPERYAPKTTKVEGLCLQNPEEEEEENWVWNRCPHPHMNDAYFMELWTAVRGGGGGFGINLKIYFQLHHYPGKLEYLTLPWGEGNSKNRQDNGGRWFHENNIDRTFCGALDLDDVPSLEDNFPGSKKYKTVWRIFNEFNLFFGLFPKELNEKLSKEDGKDVTEVDAYLCGSPASGPFNRYCYGGGAVAQVEAWGRYLEFKRDNLKGAGIADADIEGMKGCYATTTFEDYFEMVVLYGKRARANSEDVPERTKYNEKAGDTPGPFYFSTTVFAVPFIVPRQYIEDYMNDAIEKYNPYYNAFGGFSSKTGDQADALSEAYRDGGYWTLLTLTEVVNSTLAAGDPFRDGISTSVLNDDFFSEGGDFRKMYDITSGKFPGFVSHNHLSLSPRGPMKDDKYYRKACDMTKSQAVIDEECMSAQEIVFGTDRLRRLEATQRRVDPTGMLICRNCINDNVKHKYARFGPGACMDDRGQLYSSEKYLVRDDAVACSEKCEENKQHHMQYYHTGLYYHTGFTFSRPVQFGFIWVNCWCHYEFGHLPRGVHYPLGHADYFFGKGQVSYSSGDSPYSCYKHNEYMQ